MSAPSHHFAPIEVDEKVLALLRARSGEHLSGGLISRKLAVTPDAVAGHVRNLRDQGYKIEMHPRLGYRLISAPDVLLPQEIRRSLQTSSMGCRVYCYRRVRSTNEVALRMARSGAAEGALVLAEEQVAGRGRLGRMWHSPPGLGLWFSLVLRPDISPDRVFQLTICGALAAAETFSERFHLPVKVKWPNDVIIRAGKVAGVLVETQLDSESVPFAVLGMGINVNHSPGDFPISLRNKATSLKMEWGRMIPRVELLCHLLTRFESLYTQFESHGLGPFLNRWRQLSAIIGRRIEVCAGGRRFSGLAVDIDALGALVLKEDNGHLQHLLAGDVSLSEEESCG